MGTSEPKSCLREISKEVAQRAGELRGLHLSRREPERSSPRRSESRHRGTDGHQHQRSHTKGEPFPSWSSYVTFPSSAICQTGDYVVTSLGCLHLSLPHVQPASSLFHTWWYSHTRKNIQQNGFSSNKVLIQFRWTPIFLFLFLQHPNCPSKSSFELLLQHHHCL